jgi:hypothetical protein
MRGDTDRPHPKRDPGDPISVAFKRLVQEPSGKTVWLVALLLLFSLGWLLWGMNAHGLGPFRSSTPIVLEFPQPPPGTYSDLQDPSEEDPSPAKTPVRKAPPGSNQPKARSNPSQGFNREPTGGPLASTFTQGKNENGSAAPNSGGQDEFTEVPPPDRQNFQATEDNSLKSALDAQTFLALQTLAGSSSEEAWMALQNLTKKFPNSPDLGYMKAQLLLKRWGPIPSAKSSIFGVIAEEPRFLDRRIFRENLHYWLWQVDSAQFQKSPNLVNFQELRQSTQAYLSEFQNQAPVIRSRPLSSLCLLFHVLEP